MTLETDFRCCDFFGQELFSRLVRKNLCRIVLSPFWISTMAHTYKRILESDVMGCGVFFFAWDHFQYKDAAKRKVQKHFYRSPSEVSSPSDDTELLKGSRI